MELDSKGRPRRTTSVAKARVLAPTSPEEIADIIVNADKSNLPANSEVSIVQLHASAQRLYLQGMHSVADIAKVLGVKYDTVKSWATKGKWAQLLEELNASPRVQVAILKKQRRELIEENQALFEQARQASIVDRSDKRTLQRKNAALILDLNKIIDDLDGEASIDVRIQCQMDFMRYFENVQNNYANIDRKQFANLCAAYMDDVRVMVENDIAIEDLGKPNINSLISKLNTINATKNAETE
jgi:transposase-like protein